MRFEKPGEQSPGFHRKYLILPQSLYNALLNILHESYDGGCQADQQNNSCDNQQRNYRIVKSCIRNHSSKGSQLLQDQDALSS